MVRESNNHSFPLNCSSKFYWLSKKKIGIYSSKEKFLFKKLMVILKDISYKMDMQENTKIKIEQQKDKMSISKQKNLLAIKND